MKRINPKLELWIVVCICTFAATLIFSKLLNPVYSSLAAAGTNGMLIHIYCYFVKPRIENMLSGTYCEPTQKDAYNLEDESEVTHR